MSYNPSIPQSTDLISQSQSQILTNFGQLDTQFGVDHTAFSAASDNGKHQKVTMPEQGAAPTTAASEVAIYTKDTVTTGDTTQPEIYVRQESSGTEFLLTRGTPVSSSGEGTCYGGLQIRAGSGTTPTPVTFGTRFPTNIISVVATPVSTASQINITATSATGFTAQEGGAPAGIISFRWIAIGY